MSLRRRVLLPVVPVYAAVVRWKRQLYNSGRLQQRTLRNAVISVGSVSAGGAGKTPFVLLLADALRRRGYAIRILTRGYGRASQAVERVDPAGDARRYGDEPMLLARRSGAPVYVSADRYQAGCMAEESLPAEEMVVHLLDDGFQHRKLARDLDIVLLTLRDVQDFLLPAGDLREPLSTLREADVIVVREDEVTALRGFLSGLRREGGTPPVWEIRRRLRFPSVWAAKLPKQPLAFCGIARPDGFGGMLAAEGCQPATMVVFGDHHGYGDSDIADLLAAAKASGADGFITTEKDAVKLTGAMRARLETQGPLVVPELHVELVDERGALEQMLTIVKRLDRRRSGARR